MAEEKKQSSDHQKPSTECSRSCGKSACTDCAYSTSRWFCYYIISHWNSNNPDVLVLPYRTCVRSSRPSFWNYFLQKT